MEHAPATPTVAIRQKPAPTVLEIARCFAGEHVTPETLIDDLDAVDWEFICEGIEDDCYVHLGTRVEDCTTLADLQALVDRLAAEDPPLPVDDSRDQYLAEQAWFARNPLPEKEWPPATPLTAVVGLTAIALACIASGWFPMGFAS